MKRDYNCRITKVKTKIRKDLTITVALEFMSIRDKEIHLFSKEFHDVKENANFRELMHYAGTKKLKKLKGRVIREIIDEDENFIGIGDPIQDEFTLF